MGENEVTTTNFITEIIDEHNHSGRFAGNVLTRFPPEPNGYLHIGHAKSICLNFGIAQKYGGKTNLRFDDTNPLKENIEYVESIQEDVKWLGFEWDGEVLYASDYFEQLYVYALELIEQGKAYVDDLSAEEIRAYRGSLTQAGKNRDARW
jgi:glutaminyl-tRNA synthetase